MSPAQTPPDESHPGGAGDLLRRFWPFLAVAIFAGALAVLHRELAAYRFADIACRRRSRAGSRAPGGSSGGRGRRTCASGHDPRRAAETRLMSDERYVS